MILGFLQRLFLSVVILIPFALVENSWFRIFTSELLILSLILLAKKRIIFIFICSFLLTIGLLQLIYVNYAGKLIDEYYWIASKATNFNEAASFVNSMSFPEMLTYILYIIFSAYLVRLINDFNKSKKYNILGAISFISFTLVMINFFGLGDSRLNELQHIYPIYIVDTYKKANANLSSLIAETNIKYQLGPSKSDDIYLFLGESASKLRMSAYGYPKSTTPYMEDKRWIKFEDYVANGLNTQPNLKALFSGKVLNANQVVEYDLIRAAQKAGFKVIYIDNNKYKNVDPIYVISAQSDRYISLNGLGKTTKENDDRIKFDEEIDPYFQRVLADPARKLVIIHLAGSHPSQDRRYPKKFDIFNNSYDSSISYTDFLIGNWVKQIDAASQGRAVAMFYVSDHGVKIPPGCGFGLIPASDYKNYGADDRYYSSIAVPFFVRFSSKFLALNPKYLANVKAHTEDKIDHTTIFPSITQLMGFNWIESYDMNKSIFSDSKNISFIRFNNSHEDIDLRIQENKICVK
jgi:glucan phosphoethanolaminetransferase (alkaline phosphatase superfamily)